MGRKKRKILWQRAAAAEAAIATEVALQEEIETAHIAAKEAQVAVKNLETALSTEKEATSQLETKLKAAVAATPKATKTTGTKTTGTKTKTVTTKRKTTKK